MANVTSRITLPSGEEITATFPEEWDKAQVRSALESRGVDFRKPGEGLGQPQSPDMPNFGEGQTINRPKEEGPSFADNLNRQLGLTARHVAEGVTAVPMMVGDATNALLNYIPGVELGSPTQLFDAALTEAGLPEPATPQERVVGAMSQAVAGVGGGIKSAAKYAPALVKDAMTAQPLMQSVAAESGAGAMEVARQNDVGPMGQLGIGLVAGLFGGLAGAKSEAALGKWIDMRAKTAGSITESELKAKLEGEGLTPDGAQVTQLTDGINRLREAGQVRQQTLDALVPDVKKDTVQVAREKSRVARKQFEEDIKAIFTDDAERKDFVERVVKQRQEQAVTDANAPIEVRRAQQKLGVQAKRDAELMTKIRDRQMAELEKMAAERTTPETQTVSNAVRANESAAQAKAYEQSSRMAGDYEGVRRNENIVRTKSGDVSKWETFAQKNIKRIEALAPRLATAIRKSTVMTNRAVKARIDSAQSWLGDREIKRAMRKDMTFKAAVLNRDLDTMDRIIPGSAKKYEPVAQMLDQYEGLLKQSGHAVQEAGFHPRVVKNLKALQRQINRNPERANAYAKAEEALKKELKRDWITENERATLISKFVSGHPVKTFRGRTIRTVSPEVAKHYMDPNISLFDYIHRMEENISARQFFKDTLGEAAPLGKSMDAADLKTNIGHVLAKSVKEGDVRQNDINALADSIDAHFGAGRQGPGEMRKKAKDFFTAMTLGFNPLSTLTQLSDVMISGVKFGPINTIKAAFGPQVADLYEAGLRNYASDTRRAGSKMEAFVRTGLKSMGFERLDKFGNKIAMKAAFRKRWVQASKDPDKLMKELEPLFGRKDAQRIIDDLNNRVYSDDVATLMAHDIADIRPIGREDMPLHYNKDPKGRLKYSLLSWSINQFNYVRNAAFRDIQQGIRTGNMKVAGKGVAKLIGLTTAFGLANVPAGITKDLLQGKELDPVHHFEAGMIPFGMTAKYMLGALMSHQPGAAVATAVPWYSIPASAAAQVLQGVASGDATKLLQLTPTMRSLYNVLTGDGLPVLAGAALSMIPEAGAAYAPGNHDATAGAQFLPPEQVPAANNLPVGAQPLPEPTQAQYQQMNAPQVDPAAEAQMQEEIAREQAARAEQDAAAKKRKAPAIAARFISKHETAYTKAGGWDGKTFKPYTSIETGNDTIAHGHKLTDPEVAAGTININGKEVPYKDGLSEAQAADLLEQDMARAGAAVDELVSYPLTENQKAALTSLVYNVGRKSFAKSKALEYLNAGKIEDFKREAFSSRYGWTKATVKDKKTGKKVKKLVAGLVTRRMDEQKLWETE